ncbi:MAG: CcmD family protein [Armatimonadota bacterium]|nr:CcmD family protein [Armatimonadota bacterium]
MSPMMAIMIAPLIVWIGIFIFLVKLDRQVKNLTRK